MNVNEHNRADEPFALELHVPTPFTGAFRFTFTGEHAARQVIMDARLPIRIGYGNGYGYGYGYGYGIREGLPYGEVWAGTNTGSPERLSMTEA